MRRDLGIDRERERERETKKRTLSEEPSAESWEPPKFQTKKRLSEWSSSRNSRVFFEKLSELHPHPNSCENPIFGAILGATPGPGWKPKFHHDSRSVSLKIGVVPARQKIGVTISTMLLYSSTDCGQFHYPTWFTHNVFSILQRPEQHYLCVNSQYADCETKTSLCSQF